MSVVRIVIIPLFSTHKEDKIAILFLKLVPN